MQKSFFIFLVVYLALVSGALALEYPPGYQSQQFTSNGKTIEYQLMTPKVIETGKKYPLVVILHGNDKSNNPLTKIGTSLFSDVKEREAHPCYVMAPLCSAGNTWSALTTSGNSLEPKAFSEVPTETMKLLTLAIDALVRSTPIDTNRQYLTGFGMGAFGVWDIIVRQPNTWAAAAPLGGGAEAQKFTLVKNMPIWVTSSLRSTEIKVQHSRAAVKTLSDAGGQPLYSEYGLEAAESFYTGSEPEFTNWMFAQAKGKAMVPFKTAATPFAKPPTNLCAGEGYMQSLNFFPKKWQDYRKAWSQNIRANQGAVVFLGDSITDVWTDRYNNVSWTSLEKEFSDFKVVNMGIAGDLSRGVLERLDDVIALNPKAVNLLIGTNDFSFGDVNYDKPDNYEVCNVILRNTQEIIRRLHLANPEMTVILNTVMPRGIVKIQKLNELLKSTFSTNPKVVICDAYAIFVKANSNNVKDGYTSDGVHPVKAGYDAWAKALKPLLYETVKFKYSYQPYNEGRMSPQLTGWPLTSAENLYLQKADYERRPGSEANKYLPAFWPITPIADGGGANGPWFVDAHRSLQKVVETYKKENGSDIDVLLIGDSITWQWCGMDAYSSYPQPFNSVWKENFANLKTVNIGIGGDKTQGILWRLDHGGDILGGLNPRVVILAIGHNDMFFTPQTGCEAAAKGIQWCIKNVRHKFPTAEIIVSKILPNTSPDAAFYKDAIAINTELDKLKVDADSNVHVLPDLWKKMTNADGSIIGNMFNAKDKVHLTIDGYKVWAAALKPVVTELLNKPKIATRASVTTSTVTGITALAAKCGGWVTGNGGAALLERGICWSTFENPTILDQKSAAGNALGSFSANINNLNSETIYYTRAYAINNLGVSYGDQRVFSTAYNSNPKIKPTITSKLTLQLVKNGAIAYTITADQRPESFDAQNLPNGFTINKTTGEILGSSDTVGIFNVIIMAKNSAGTGSANLSLNIIESSPEPIYAEGAVGLWVVNGWGATMIGKSYDNPHSGSQSFAITFNNAGDEAGLLNTGGKIDISPYKYLTFWIHGGQQGGQKINLRVYPLSGAPSNYALPTLNANGWVKMAIPLTDLFREMPKEIYVIRFGEASGSTHGTFYVDDITLISGEPTSVPIVTTSDALSVDGESAIINGSVTSNGGEEVLSKGVCWSVNPTPTINHNKSTDFSTTTSIHSTLFGLNSNTTYYYRTYAINAVGVGYGPNKSFTTAPENVSSQIPQFVSANSAHGNIGGEFIFQVQAKYFPKSYSATGLPNGLAFNSKSGLISGFPKQEGTFNIDLRATNAAGTRSSTLILTIEKSLDLVLYEDAITIPWYQNGWESNMVPNSSVLPYRGRNSLAITLNTQAAAGGVIYTGGSFDTSPYGYLSFYINGGQGGQNLKLVATAGGGNGVPLLVTLPVLKPNTWVKHSIPLSRLGISNTKDLSVLRFQNLENSQLNTFYIDDLIFGYGENPTLPTVATQNVELLTSTSARIGGSISGQGGSELTVSGVCWNTNPNPTTSNSNTQESPKLGEFSSNVTKLLSQTTYYVRAYATNSVGTAYGDEMVFSTNLNLKFPKISFAQGSSMVNEKTKTINIMVELSSALRTDLVVPISTTGSALTPTDFEIKKSPLIIKAGTVSANIEIAIKTDLFLEGPETVEISLGSITNVQKGMYSTHVLTLLDNDAPVPAIPVINSPASATGKVGQAFNYSIQASNNPILYGAQGLPKGCVLNTATGIISGIPSESGIFSVTLSANNSNGKGTGSLRLTIESTLPSITSALKVSGLQGQSFSYQILASQNPTQFSALGLPNGLSLNATTGMIQGTLSSNQNIKLTISASNGQGTSTKELLIIVGRKVLDYPYAPYNNGQMSRQIAGWPLTEAELEYLKLPDFGGRKPGDEAGKHLPAMWPVTPCMPSNASLYLPKHENMLKGIAQNLNPDILLIGDSITEAWGGGFGNPTTFIAPWKQYFSEFTTVNIGIAGDKTDSLLWRLDHGAIDGVNAKYIVLLIGVNNSNHVTSNNMPVEKLVEGIKLCIENIRIRSPLSHIIAVKILPGFTPGHAPFTDIVLANKAIDALNMESDSKVHVLDLWNDFMLNNNTMNSNLYLNDMLHINTNGYEVYAARLKGFITQIQSIGIPKISSSGNITAKVGQPFSYQISASQNPTSYEATPLPEGLAVNKSTGNISGTPKSYGNTTVMLKATNASGSGQGRVSIVVLDLPTVKTNAVNNILTTSVTCGGNVSNPGDASGVLNRGLCWSTSSNPTVAASNIVVGTGVGPYSTRITGLAPAKTYYVRAFAVNRLGVGYGETVSFTTSSITTIPTLKTTEVSKIGINNALCGGNIIHNGGEAIMERGLCWGLSLNPSISNNKMIYSGNNLVYSLSIVGLAEQTTYYVRAYAKNSVGIAYGENQSFLTGKSIITLIYPYAPYNEKKMDPQLTGWPLTEAEKIYITQKLEYMRRPGNESYRHLPTMWPVTPAAGTYYGALTWLAAHESLINVANSSSANVDILLLGDSHLKSLCISPDYNTFPQIYNNIWQKAFPTQAYKTLNLSMDDDKCQNILWRLDHGAVEKLNPKCAVLAVGSRNLVFTPETGVKSVADGIQLCVKNLRQKCPQTQIIIVKLFPNNNPKSQQYKDALAVNSALDTLNLESDTMVRVLDLWKDMVNTDGSLKNNLFQDTVRLNSNGQEVLSNRLKPLIDNILSMQSVRQKYSSEEYNSELSSAGGGCLLK